LDVSLGSTCGNGIVEPGEDCDNNQTWCVNCRYSTSVAAAITQQLESTTDPLFTIELTTILKSPFQPGNPRFVSTPPLQITTFTYAQNPNSGRVCNNTFGSDCGQGWFFYYWMGGGCENPTGTYDVTWDIVCRDSTSCLPFVANLPEMNNVTSTLTISFSVSVGNGFCNDVVIDTAVNYQIILYNDAKYTQVATAFMTCGYVYASIQYLNGPNPATMTVDTFQINGGYALVSGGAPQAGDVTLTYIGINAHVSFQITSDRFMVPPNGVLNFGLFANLGLTYSSGKRSNSPNSTPVSSVNVTSCTGQCVSTQCVISTTAAVTTATTATTASVATTATTASVATTATTASVATTATTSSAKTATTAIVGTTGSSVVTGTTEQVAASTTSQESTETQATGSGSNTTSTTNSLPSTTSVMTTQEVSSLSTTNFVGETSNGHKTAAYSIVTAIIALYFSLIGLSCCSGYFLISLGFTFL